MEKFDKEFPERNRWEYHLESLKLLALANALSQLIFNDLETEARHFVPGLRLALNTLKEIDKETMT